MTEPTKTLGEPLAALRLVSEGPLENRRGWIDVETLYSCALSPGEPLLVSVGTQPVKSSRKASSFAPASVSPDTFFRDPPQLLRKNWGLPTERCGSEPGEYCVGCEIWPKARLKKGEIALSSALCANLGQPPTGTVIYLHKPTHDPSLCQRLRLEYRSCSSAVGEERQEWIAEVLSGGGETQTRVLKTLILNQLNGRLLLRRTPIPVLLLGCTLLFEVTQLDTEEGKREAAMVDSDVTALDLTLSTNKADDPVRDGDEEQAYLDGVAASAGRDVDGSRKEAAMAGAREAARCGLAARNRGDLESIVFPGALRNSLESLIVMPLTRPTVFESMGLTPPRGVIVHGPPGSGKTLLASWAARAADSRLFVINGPSLISEYFGGTEASLTGVFAAARAHAPSIVFLDEADAMLPSRGGGGGRALNDGGAGDASIRRVTALLAQFDALEGCPVVVLAATNRLESLDEALRRPGRFDREIEMTPLTPQLRATLLTRRLKTVAHALTTENIASMAEAAHGFLPVDLTALCREASLCALRRHVTQGGPLTVQKTDFDRAAELISPSGLREVQIEVPRVKWEDIGGGEDIKQQLRESVEWPLRHASSLDRLGTTPPKGVLLFGPPGCSKTLLAKAVATETGMNFVSVSGAELMSVYVGESEKAIAKLFMRARQVAPCVIFLDELDGLVGHRGDSGDDGTSVSKRVLAQLLTELDGVRERGQVVVIGATNKPQLLDPAVLRPGRFDRLILVSPPDVRAREAVFKIQFRRMAVGADVDAAELAQRTTGYTGADIVSLCRQAGIRALEETLEATEIGMRHFIAVLEASVPSLGDDEEAEMHLYTTFERRCRS